MVLNIGGTEEIAEKERRIHAFLRERNLAALLLSGTHNFAWATCGRDNHVVKCSDNGVGHVLYTLDNGKYLLCDNIEAGRLCDEEQLEAQGFQIVSGPWYEFNTAAEAQRIVGVHGTWGADTPLSGATFLSGEDIAPLRYSLVPDEIERHRWLGGIASLALEQTAQAIDAGMSEHEVGAVLDHFLQDEGVTPFLTLVASDERIEKYRHPIPTDKTVENYVMYVTGASAYGLIVCATRLVYFGTVPETLARKHQAVCQIDTVYNASTVVGASVGEIFAHAQATYADTGFADEWQKHHQGGATGYTGRDYKATSKSNKTVQPHQAFAWNPSITGTKMEDTIIAGEPGTLPEVLTACSEDWPTQVFETPYGTMTRPLILER